MLKKDKRKMDEQKRPDISLVDLIETERNALGANLVSWPIPYFFYSSIVADGQNSRRGWLFVILVKLNIFANKQINSLTSINSIT